MSSQLSRFLIFFMSALLIPSFAWGAKKKTQMSAPSAFKTTYTKKQFKKKVKKLKRIQRKIAKSDNRTESLLSPQAREIRNHIIGGEVSGPDGKKVTETGINTAAKLDEKLKSIRANLQSGEYTSDDAKLLAAQLNVLGTLQGFAYRSRNIFETRSGKARFAQTFAVTALRATIAGIDTYLPTQEWSAGFDYFVKPYYKGNDRRPMRGCTSDTTWLNQPCDIRNGNDYQTWLRLELLPTLEKLSETIHEIANKSNPVVYFDNKILYGTANFTHSRDRFVRLGQPELYLMLSGTQAMMSSIYGINAYSFEGLFESIDSVAKVYGFNATFRSEIAMAKHRFNAIRRHKNLFKLKSEDPNHKTYLDNSYKSLKASLQNSYYAWTLLRANNSNMQENLIDPRAVVPFNRILNTGFNNVFGIVGVDSQNGLEIASGEVISAVVAGEKVTVKLKNFFTNPPSSLQNFMPLPSGFKGKSPASQRKGYGEGRDVLQVRDYREGNPQKWNTEAYKPYFGTVESNDDIKRISRVLAQSWGGFLLGLPMAMVMM